jgi:hypothetical protein
VEFDKGAKDITRVFFTTADEDLLFLEKSLFEIEEVESVATTPDPSSPEEGTSPAEGHSAPLPSREGDGGGSSSLKKEVLTL